LLRVFKGASVKMPMPQLEILHPPQPLSELIRCLWNKGLPVCNQKWENERWKKKVSSDCLLTKGPNKNSSKGSKCICIRTTRKTSNSQREDERSLGLPVHMSIVYFPWPSIHPIHSCLSKSDLQTINRSSSPGPSVLRLWSVCGHLPSRHWSLELRNISHVQLRSVGCWWCPGCATLRVRHPPGLDVSFTLLQGRHPRVPEKTNLNVKHHSKTVAWIDFSISFGDVFT
jgi:hypothetical protein